MRKAWAARGAGVRIAPGGHVMAQAAYERAEVQVFLFIGHVTSLLSAKCL
jgi:hypothetical protein